MRQLYVCVCARDKRQNICYATYTENYHQMHIRNTGVFILKLKMHD